MTVSGGRSWKLEAKSDEGGGKACGRGTPVPGSDAEKRWVPACDSS